MKKRISKILVALILTLTLILGATLGVVGGSLVTDVKAQIDSEMSINLNGLDYRPKNSDGSQVPLLLYNGATYLPVRAIGNVFKVAVDWDEKTKTVLLGEKSEFAKLTQVDDIKITSNKVKLTRDADILTLKNLKFESGFYFDHMAYQTGNLYINLNKRYSILKFRVGSVGDTETCVRCIVYDSETSEVLKDITLKPDDDIKEVNVDVKGVNKVEFRLHEGSLIPKEIRFVMEEPLLK